ncbi:XRE family transcriptional regulator [Duganella aceris]|uniref:ImmA/IrrE family metallo-endopeptidase n=1 Tax=Duganella aceris TaxID=2703883 RepID=A0ABX0FMV5_9BURK|nr:XRE family transcriptional regulator [Duganella aceris]NGZ85908.1 ImmA/IrrE family metallo-endopeptidase [Duganella aceris]
MEFEQKVRPDELGGRVRAVRVAARMTQEVAATRLGMSRTTMVAIEAGKRAISSSELRKIAELFDVHESELLDVTTPMLDMAVEFRSNVTEAESADEVMVASMLNRMARSVVQLETLVGFPSSPLDMPGVMLSRDEPLEQQAEDAALALRARLGLGIGSIQDLNGLMESELGVRIFERALPSKVSGAKAFSDSAGGFVLLNAKHPNYRRRVTAAHELAHILLRQQGVSVHFANQSFDSREEKFCDVFACCLLMPAAAVRKKANELKKIVGKFTVRELLTMTLYFNVSMEALVRRMVALNLVPNGMYERLKADGFALKHQDIVREELGLSPEPPAFTARTMLLAMAAHKKELLSEQQIASMLELDLVSARRALEDHGESEHESALELVP